MEIQDVLASLVEYGGSDLHLKVGEPPVMRIQGHLERTDCEALTAAEMQRWIASVAAAEMLARIERDHEGDFSYLIPGCARFRCNVFYQMGQLGGVFRVIPSQVPTLESLGMPEVLRLLVERENGVVLVTGPTGSGKSTTLAAMLDHVNRTRPKHILTIEDPIEFVHTDALAVINQREVGSDTASFSEALRRALRQDPDVILVGEMRDPETIRIAMTASETGHLVLSTLHTNDAKQSVDRVINTFPPEEQHQVRMKLALTLAGVVSQRLVRRADGVGRIAVQEIMVNSPTIRKLIEDGKTGAIDKVIEDSTDFYGMQSLNSHLMSLCVQGIISEEQAASVSNNPNDLRLKIQTARFESVAPSDTPAGWEPAVRGGPPTGAGGSVSAPTGPGGVMSSRPLPGPGNRPGGTDGRHG